MSDKNTVHVLYNNAMDCYDCPSELVGVYSTREKAEEKRDKIIKNDYYACKKDYDIEEVEVDENIL